MTIADAGFNEAEVVSVKSVASDFETAVMSSILVHYLSKNYNNVYIKGEAAVKFPSKEEMIKAYWSELLD